ncbi:hypothetical protein DMUE_4807 [Dictyocoela muelleri]|nr:hypothetical protein DMUE_4807 [Dictyocoela muelleri]
MFPDPYLLAYTLNKFEKDLNKRMEERNNEEKTELKRNLLNNKDEYISVSENDDKILKNPDQYKKPNVQDVSNFKSISGNSEESPKFQKVCAFWKTLKSKICAFLKRTNIFGRAKVDESDFHINIISSPQNANTREYSELIVKENQYENSNFNTNPQILATFKKNALRFLMIKFQ